MTDQATYPRLSPSDRSTLLGALRTAIETYDADAERAEAAGNRRSAEQFAEEARKAQAMLDRLEK